MSVNPPDIAAPLLLLDPADWPAAIGGDYADMPLIFDLHPDGPEAASLEAGKALLAFLQQRNQTAVRGSVLVRIGSFTNGQAESDLAIFKDRLPDAILLSGCRNTADIQKLDVLLAVIEAGASLPMGGTTILAECGAEAEFFLSTHYLSGKSARLRGLVLNGPALARSIGIDIDDPRIDPTGGPLSFARAVCVLKAAEAQLSRYEMLSPKIGSGELVQARAASMANGFNDIVVSRPAHLLTLSTGTTVV